MSTLYTEDQLKNLIMSCPNQNTEYKSPDVMVDGHGNRIYAYVTLVMLGDRYVAGAIVLAHSIKRLDSQADLVVLVTPDVSDAAKRILSNFFDRVILVEPIYVPNWRVKNQPQRKYLSYVFTKFHLFNLTQYKKIIMIDADALILQYPDHLFTLNAPAGCLIEYKNQFISYDKNGNYILPPNNEIEWYKIFCDCCKHGNLIPKNYTDRVATDFKNSGIGASIVLLQPKKGELESILKDVNSGRMKYLVQNKFIWPEQQYLTLRYSGSWTSFDPRFYGLQGYPHWSVLYSLQYAGDKPFFLDSKTDISIRTKYPDFVLWHKFYSEILEQYPLLKNNEVLDEANQLHQFFIVQLHQHRRLLSRYTFNKTPDQIKNHIKNLLLINRVNDPQLDMYYLDPKLSFRPFKLKQLFNDIEEYDYLKPIVNLSRNFRNTDYFNDLLKKNITVSNTRFDQISSNNNKIDDIDRDNIMLQYIRCRSSCFVITVWPIAFHLLEQIANELSKEGNVYYVKKLQLSYNGLKNLMFWMYDEFSFHERDVFIQKKLDYVKTKRYENNDFGIIIFDNVKNVKISGQASEFKKYLRNYAIGLLNLNDPEIRGNDIIHINDHFYQTVNYCELLLNINSINLLDKQEIHLSHMHQANEKACHFKFQTFLKFLYLNLSPLELSKIILTGGIVLYCYGVRPAGDIDSLMTHANNAELEQLMFDNFQNKKTKFSFADMGIEGKYWLEKWTYKNEKLFNIFGIKSVSDLICNPRFHMYFQGIKIYLLDHELSRKLFRHKSQDCADFMVMLLYYRNLVDKYVTIDENTLKMIVKPLIIDELDLPKDIDKADQLIVDEVYNTINKKYSNQIKSKISIDMIKKLLL